MSKRRYRPYRSRKQESRRLIRNVLLAAVLVAVVVLIMVKTSAHRDAAGENAPAAGSEDTRPVDDVLPRTNVERRVVDTPSTQAIDLTSPPATTSQPRAETPAVPAAAPVATTPEEPIVVTTTQEPAITPVTSSEDDENSPTAAALIEEANRLRGEGKLIAERDLLNHALDLKLSPRMRAAVKERMGKLSEEWLFSGNVYESDKLTAYYVVQPGDLLAVISKRYNVPYEALMDINHIERAELLQAGQKLKIIKGPFNAVIYKSNFTLDLYLQNVYVKTYRVGLGQAQYETPTGRWRVKASGKMVKPKWTDPDTGKTYSGSSPDYPLGSRWIGLEGLEGDARGRTGFAIHGTKDPDSIGTRASRGCIRLYNGDVVELYNLMQDGLSEVLVVE